MKILQVCPKFLDSIASGSTKVAYDISMELAKRGHSVTVYTSDMKNKYDKVNVDFEKIDGVSIYRFKSVFASIFKGIKFFFTPSIIPRLKKDIRSFDIIHLHELYSFQNIILVWYAKKYGIPYALQTHGSIPPIGKKYGKWLYYTFFGHNLLKSASKVIAITQKEAEYCRSLGALQENIVIVPNGIDLSNYCDLPQRGLFRKKYSIDQNVSLVTYVGRLHKSKGLDMLLEAFSLVLKKEPNVYLVIIGPNDGYLESLERTIKNLRIERNVLLRGFVGESEKKSALIDSDVFVTPKFSGFPITFLESCALGCPIVSISRDLDWIHNKVGYLAEKSSFDLSKAILSILQDQDITNVFRNNCKEIISQFSIAKIVAKLESVYAQMTRHI